MKDKLYFEKGPKQSAHMNDWNWSINLESLKINTTPSEYDYSIMLTDAKSTLYPIAGYKLDCRAKKPNAWWRFWQWALLGWKWEDK